MGTVFTSPSALLHSSSISWRGAFTHVWCPIFLWLEPMGYSLAAWLWGPGQACVPGSHRTVTIGDTVLGRLPPEGHCPYSRLKHMPSLSVKETSMLILEFWGMLLLQHTSRGAEEILSGNTGLGTPPLHSLSALPQLTGTLQKGVYNLVWNLDFLTLVGQLEITGLSWPVGLACGPTGLYIFAYIKSCCMRFFPLGQ